MSFHKGVEYLVSRGLNMLAVLTGDMAPDSFHSALQAAGMRCSENSRIVIAGHSGNHMWDVLNQPGERYRMSDPDPIDSYSLDCVQKFVTHYLNDCPYQVLYPGNIPIPLQQLGAVANWHHASPLGVGIHPRYGPWFGYRAVFLLTSDLPVTFERAEPSPCDRCTTKPCISTCPASALFADRLPDVGACVSYRTATDSKSGKVRNAVEKEDRSRYDPDDEPGSVCALTCLARQACPVGASHRYSESQMRYFYGRSLTSIKKYLAAQRSAV